MPRRQNTASKTIRVLEMEQSDLGLGQLDRLPLEIRDIIYDFVIHTPHWKGGLDGTDSFSTIRFLARGSLLKVNKQICVEFLSTVLRGRTISDQLFKDHYSEKLLKLLDSYASIIGVDDPLSTHLHGMGLGATCRSHSLSRVRSISGRLKTLRRCHDNFGIPTSKLFCSLCYESPGRFRSFNPKRSHRSKQRMVRTAIERYTSPPITAKIWISDRDSSIKELNRAICLVEDNLKRFCESLPNLSTSDFDEFDLCDFPSDEEDSSDTVSVEEIILEFSRTETDLFNAAREFHMAKIDEVMHEWEIERQRAYMEDLAKFAKGWTEHSWTASR